MKLKIISGIVGISASITPLYAQTAAPVSPSASPPEADIVVTAQRREQLLRDVPISVTALSADSLKAASITNTGELALVTPGLRIEAVGVYVQPSIRGITTTTAGPLTDNNVATYLDGVFQQNQVIFQLPDVKSIEVLKGPQGTLYGRNATGGAILVNTLDPELQHLTGKVTVSYGNLKASDVSGYVSIPLVEDKLAVSITAQSIRDGEYNRNLLNGGARQGGVDTDLIRGKIRFVPVEGVDLLLTGSYSKRVDKTNLNATFLNGNSDANRDPSLPPVPIATKPYDFASNVDEYSRQEPRSVSFRAKIATGLGDLTSTTAYYKTRDGVLVDSDAGPRADSTALIDQFTEATSQDLIFSMNRIGNVRLLIGASLYWGKGAFDPLQVLNVGYIYTIDKVFAQAYFGDLSWTPSDKIELTGGLRYSTEKREGSAAFTLAPSNDIIRLGQKRFSAISPHATATYHITDSTNVYASYSRGFKSGYFNSIGFQPTPVEPEIVDSYEVGLKTGSSRNLSANLAAFYMNYRDLQVSGLITLNGTNLTVTQNAAKARIYGAEGDVTWRSDSGFRVTAGASYLNAKYTSYPNASSNVPNPDGRGGNIAVSVDASGNHLIRAPEVTLTLAPSYEIEFDKGRLSASAALYHSSRIYFDANNRVSQPAYTTVNARLAWISNDGWELAAFGRNITDTHYISSTQITAPYGDQTIYAPPRMYGVKASINF